MGYKVVVTADAVDDIEGIVRYLIVEKQSLQAASTLLDDFEDTIESLRTIASSLKICDNSKLKEYGYRRKNFRKHKYFLMYRILNNVVYVDKIFHELQDYENMLV